MGNYYAGMINNTGGYGELKHHGILGQKWGIRRFQNADGSLTAAGRERYYGKKGQKEIAKALRGNGAPYFNREASDRVLKKLPQFQDAAKQLSAEAIQVHAAAEAVEESFDRLYDKLYSDSKLHEKWLNKAVDNYMEKNKPNASRKEIYEMFRDNEDEIDEGGVVDTFLKESKDPDVKRHLDIYKEYRDIYKPYSDKQNKLIEEMYPNRIAKAFDHIRLRSALNDLAIEYGKTSSESIPKTGMPKVSLRDRISNFYNGRTSGETDSTKVKDMTLRRQMENNIRSNTMLQDNWDFRGKSAREERDLSKKFVKTSLKEFDDARKVGHEVWEKTHDPDAYRKAESKRWEKVRADADEYMRNVAKIRLKSMGYEVTKKAVDNLVSKDWFKNSLWIQNTLASIGADGVKYTSKDDMLFK